MYPGGNIVKVAPTLSTDAYGAADLLFDKQEIKSCVPSRGGTSLLRSMSMHQDITTDVDFIVMFFNNSTSLGASANDALSAVSDEELQAAGFIGAFGMNGGQNSMSIGNGRLYTYRGTNDIGMPLLVQAPSDKTSIWFAVGTEGGTPTYAADSLSFTFGFQYLG